MAFNGLSFVFLFFPAVLLIHWAVPAVLKNTVLLIFSLIFFAWGSPTYVLLMILPHCDQKILKLLRKNMKFLQKK